MTQARKLPTAERIDLEQHIISAKLDPLKVYAVRRDPFNGSIIAAKMVWAKRRAL